MEVLLFVLIAAVIGAVAYLGYYLKKKRREELALVARRLGLEFSAADPIGCVDLPFVLLQRGDGRGAENVLSGTWQGLPVVEFDYWYYTESTDSKGHTTRSTYRFSCAVTEVEAALSPITLDRENLFTRLADSLGMDDVTYELDEFNRAFNVKCGDARFASAFVDQRMMRWLLETDRGFSFEACGKWLLCYSNRRRPGELVPLLATLQRYREAVPRVVYDLYAPGASG